MYNVLTVQEAFMGLVGWRPHPNPAQTQDVMGDMLTSTSGMYFNDYHPMLTIENLKMIADVFEDYTYAAWNGTDTYLFGDMVTSSSKWYVSIFVGDNVNHAVTNTTYWRETNPFNEWLRNKTLAGQTKALNDWLQLKGQLRSAHNLLKKSQVLMIPGYKNENVGTTKDWLGWRIVPSPDPDVQFYIDRISIHLRGSQDITITLFKNGAVDKTTTILGDGSDDILWKEVNWLLERGNEYRVAYDRTTLTTAVPINDLIHMEKDWPYQRFPHILPYAEISAFEHDGEGFDGWEDVTDIQTNQNNYGLNMMISARCDYTNFLVDQKTLFPAVVRHAVGMTLLRELAYNPNARINRNENNINSQRLLFEIDGDTLGRAGSLRKDYDAALKMVTFDDKRLSEFCLPCKRSGVRVFSA